MKQKRKVKSLISSNDKSNVWLTALLCLLWWILVFWAVALFTSSVWVEAANNEEQFEWIDDKHEVLLNLWFIPYGGDTPVNEMFLTGNTFFVNGNKWISVNITSNSSSTGKYINLLWWDWMRISSNNITIIGWNGNVVGEKNDNAAILWWVPVGWNGNSVDEGNNRVAPVMLWWQGNKIWKNQEGSAIVWWKNNIIWNNVSYGFIIWWEYNNVGDNSRNVIVWWKKVIVKNVSDLFAFSNDNEEEFKPGVWKAFYLNLKNGLWLNEDSRGGWVGVDSKWAVSFGNIYGQNCTSEDVWVQWTWGGCLVWCTNESAKYGKWEMIDHGEVCENKCQDSSNSDYCMIDPIKPEKPGSYSGYCTTDGVDTGHSHHCGGEDLVRTYYQNIVFETKLIDSDDKCPNPTDPNNWTENRCVFKCDGWYHLTWGSDGRERCYKDCELPWDHTKIKHNETVTAYKRKEAYCSYDSDAQKGPYTCNNYKATLQCDNGVLMVKSSYGSVDNGKTASSVGYKYNECMLNQYRCDTSVYKYSYSDIVDSDKFNDTVSSRITTNRSKTEGMRWIYKLCIDYDAQTQNTVQYLNGDNCFARNYVSTNPKHYTANYQWVGCKPGYHTWAWYENVCMQDCKLDGKTIRHNQTMPAYKVKNPTCPNVCEEEVFTCNDGKLVGRNAWITTLTYQYSSCKPQGVSCDARTYDVEKDTRDAHVSTSRYSSCQNYSTNSSDIFSCITGSTVYDLIGCVDEENWHTENNEWCISNDGEKNCKHEWATVTNHFHYINKLVPARWHGQWNDWYWVVSTNCEWDCDYLFHLEDGDCQSNSRNVDCDNYYSLPSNATWDRQGYQLWNESKSEWNDPLYCTWSCDAGWHKNKAWTACETDCSVNVCSAYTLDRCPEHWHCSSCTKIDSECNAWDTLLKLDYCDTDYEVSSDGTSCEYNPSCTANYCSAYGLNECPEWWICSYCTIKYSDCTNWDQKARLDSCEDGWTKVWDTCKKSCTWCPGKDTVAHGGTCISYSACSSRPIESECADWDWIKDWDPWTYSSPNQWENCGDGWGWRDDPEEETLCDYGEQKYEVWATVEVYDSASPTCPTECSKVTATCQSNWSWDKTMNSSCTPKPSWDCSDYPLESKNVSHAKSYDTCDYYTVSSNSCDQKYKYSLRECEDGYHISEDGKSCIPDASQCTYNGTKYNVGATVQVYAATTPTCPTECSKVTATCQSNWSWDKTMNSSCTPKPSWDCSDYPLESKNVSHAKSYDTCDYYTVSSNSCDQKYKYSIKECNPGYYISADGKRCEPICNSSTDPWSCNWSFSPEYEWATWLRSYDYTCKYWSLSYSCSATCPGLTYWFGTQCNNPTSICWSTLEYPCLSPASLSKSVTSKTSWNTKTYTWQCKRGDYIEECTKTETTESCPTLYWELWTSNTIEEIIGHECGQSGTDWWELEYNGSANGNPCVKCREKSCPTWSSTTCNGAKVGFAWDSACYKCEETKNYTIVNWTSLDGDLCTSSIRYISPANLAASWGWPLTEDEACANYYAGYGDCHNDYYGGYNGDFNIYDCSSVSISPCWTTNYTQYCNSHSGWKCYISNTESSCSDTTILQYTSLCWGACSAAPDVGGSSVKRCMWSMQYVQCK